MELLETVARFLPLFFWIPKQGSLQLFPPTKLEAMGSYTVSRNKSPALGSDIQPPENPNFT
jgi:hypothetical protein